VTSESHIVLNSIVIKIVASFIVDVGALESVIGRLKHHLWFAEVFWGNEIVLSGGNLTVLTIVIIEEVLPFHGGTNVDTETISGLFKGFTIILDLGLGKVENVSFELILLVSGDWFLRFLGMLLS